MLRRVQVAEQPSVEFGDVRCRVVQGLGLQPAQRIDQCPQSRFPRLRVGIPQCGEDFVQSGAKKIRRLDVRSAPSAWAGAAVRRFLADHVPITPAEDKSMNATFETQEAVVTEQTEELSPQAPEITQLPPETFQFIGGGSGIINQY